MINYRKYTTTGSLLGRANGYYVKIYKRPHGKWCCSILKDNVIISQEGYHTTHLNTLKKAKYWAESKLKTITINNNKKQG